jgi:tRNA1Val (adenine37-N6)-methyltransferase
MPNTYFQFKQFIVHQAQSALKVSTDSCLFGAWTASHLQKSKPVESILDIGTGTGLLLLMLAQTTIAKLDGIELDAPSFREAQENCNKSPWNERISLLEGDVKIFPFDKVYDFIICNPPFFEGDLKGKKLASNRARHDTSLLLEEFLQIASRLLTVNGQLAVLLPFHRTDFFLRAAAEHSLYPVEMVYVKQSEQHSFFRTMLVLQRNGVPVKPEILSIKDNANFYTEAFCNLLKPYYLHL